MPCALFVLNALPSILERLMPSEDFGWRQNSIPISCPQQLLRFGTRFSEFRAELNRVVLLQTPMHFHPWQDTKTTTHFANVPTATKARTQLRKVKLYTWVPPPTASTTTFLSWPFCAAQKNHSHYFWDTSRMSTTNPCIQQHWDSKLFKPCFVCVCVCVCACVRARVHKQDYDKRGNIRINVTMRRVRNNTVAMELWYV